ncbi:MAG: hypothetical protein LBT09_01095 [Planctomycetaceae bacterium]|jgi:hypothetical protein|nr:hypothetical protein [Planctomycetaceae bacterium]
MSLGEFEMNIDFNEILPEGELWGQFAQEFLCNLGFYIESQLVRLPDDGCDFCVVEQVLGKFNIVPFKWLVSCRHKSPTRLAVKESEEVDVIERIVRNKVDGFIGFYSTSATSALPLHLESLKTNGYIKDYKIMDAKFIESYLVTPGFDLITSRYFPNFALGKQAVHIYQEKYLPIRCECCQKDLLETLYTNNNQGVVVRLRLRKNDPNAMDTITKVYFACKGECDEQLQTKFCRNSSQSTASWALISDLVIPSAFLERAVVLLGQVGRDGVIYESEALEAETYLLRALAQRTLRPTVSGELLRTKRMLINEE